MKLPLACRLTSVVLLLLSAAPLPAQQTVPSFKAETNLVLVPVVVRDANGDAVANLSKDDFRLFDNGHQRPITTFAMEETSGRAAQDRNIGDGPKSAAVVIPERFTALMFDDAHVGSVYSRNAALKYLEALQPADRVALFTSSGRFEVDFTADRSKIAATLMKMSAASGPTIFSGMQPERVAGFIVKQCDKIVYRMSLLPGQRTLVFISSGLPVHGRGSTGAGWNVLDDVKQLIDHAIRSRVEISALDAQGLSAAERPATRAWEFQLDVTDGTGANSSATATILTGPCGNSPRPLNTGIFWASRQRARTGRPATISSKSSSARGTSSK